MGTLRPPRWFGTLVLAIGCGKIADDGSGEPAAEIGVDASVTDARAADADGDPVTDPDFGSFDVVTTPALWARQGQEGHPVHGDAASIDIATTPTGGIVVVGNYTGALDFGSAPLRPSAAPLGVFVVQLDRGGHVDWGDGFLVLPGERDYLQANQVAVSDSGQIVVTGSFIGEADFGGGPIVGQNGGDSFLLRLDEKGRFVANQQIAKAGVASDEAGIRALTVDHDGSALVAGAFHGTVDFGGIEASTPDAYGITDAFVARIAPTGRAIWAKQLHSPDAEVSAMTLDSSGNIVLTGSFYSTIDLGAGPVATFADRDLFIAKMDGNGNLIWFHHYGVGDYESPTSLVAGADGTVFIGGPFRPPDFAPSGKAGLAHLAADGSVLWMRRFPGKLDVSQSGVSDLAMRKTGDIAAAIWFDGGLEFGGSEIDRGYGVFTVSNDGTARFAQLVSNDHPEFCYALAVDPTDHPLVAGCFGATLDWGSDVLTVPPGGYDAFVAMLAP